jgi:hypothetical protein
LPKPEPSKSKLTDINQAGSPSYAEELGRLDGLRSTNSSVDGKLLAPFFNLDQLNKIQHNGYQKVIETNTHTAARSNDSKYR